MNKLKLTLMTILVIYIASGCENLEETIADKCVLVDLIQKDGELLIPLLDDYALNVGLKQDKSHSANYRYIEIANEIIISEISYRMGMGEFGAQLSLFVFENSEISNMTFIFNEIVNHTKDLGYEVTECEDIKGYQMPRTFR